jgi:hypothetical protein
MRPLFNGKPRIDQTPFFSFQNFATFCRNFGKTDPGKTFDGCVAKID